MKLREVTCIMQQHLHKEFQVQIKHLNNLSLTIILTAVVDVS